VYLGARIPFMRWHDRKRSLNGVRTRDRAPLPRRRAETNAAGGIKRAYAVAAQPVLISDTHQPPGRYTALGTACRRPPTPRHGQRRNQAYFQALRGLARELDRPSRGRLRLVPGRTSRSRTRSDDAGRGRRTRSACPRSWRRFAARHPRCGGAGISMVSNPAEGCESRSSTRPFLAATSGRGPVRSVGTLLSRASPGLTSRRRTGRFVRPVRARIGQVSRACGG